MTCPLCGRQKARRACPALGQQICTICCGTKRLVEIACPADCVYLASAREHPPAAVVRRQQQDLSRVVELMRDFNERQSQLFFAVATFLAGYQAPELQPLADDDIAEAAAALAATLETSSRGVIYEHRPASLPAERLAAALRPVLAEAGGRGGSAFERDAAVVLRRLEDAARAPDGQGERPRRELVDLIGRVVRQPDRSERDDEKPAAPGSRLILP